MLVKLVDVEQTGKFLKKFIFNIYQFINTQNSQYDHKTNLTKTYFASADKL